jgi:hypothetical protein
MRRIPRLIAWAFAGFVFGWCLTVAITKGNQ